ncbi:MAG: hypothetical protein BroJett011_32680 [Chloroflexota bacterium]|nr:MAG: hypothetical protein BroJett011_32680 [Chloroflexota bacterium]
MEFIVLTWRLERGTSGVDNDLNNPLSRALNSLLVEGRPIESFSICFYGGEEAEFVSDRPIRWLGIFVLSVGGRVIFFPGLSINPDWIQTTIGRNISPKKPFLLDHASLEIERQRWHFTSPGSKKHYAAGRTPDLDKGTLLWFGMSVANENYLRELRQETTVEYHSPPSDSQRRLEVFKKAELEATYHAINLMDGAKSRFDQGFLHFRFIVARKDAPLYKGDNWVVPTGAPYLDRPFPSVLQQLPVHFHEVSLSGIYSIQITAFWLPGSLSIPVVFTTPIRV